PEKRVASSVFITLAP
nr:Chain C, FILAMIN-BINDING LIM PROTEIN 1 [Homo sapiens]